MQTDTYMLLILSTVISCGKKSNAFEGTAAFIAEPIADVSKGQCITYIYCVMSMTFDFHLGMDSILKFYVKFCQIRT